MPVGDPLPDLPTPAERTHYSHAPDYEEVRSYLTLLGRRAGVLDPLGQRDTTSGGRSALDLYAFDTSVDGRRIPIVVCARPMVTRPFDAHHAGRPVVLIVAGTDASDVDGTSAVLATLRDLLLAPGSTPTLLDSIVIVAVPMANPDGAETRTPTARVRADLDGPDTVGARLNARGVDLTSDILAAGAPESRHLLALIRFWDPDVILDLRTTAGGYLGYSVTLAPPRAPAALLTGAYTRDSLFPALVERLRRRGVPTTRSGRLVPDMAPGSHREAQVWDATDDRLTRLVEYGAIRNRVSLEIDAYGRARFADRVAATTAALDEALSLVAERAMQIRGLVVTADSTVETWGGNPNDAPSIPLASRADPPGFGGTILVEDVDVARDSSAPHLGAPVGIRRTGVVHPLDVTVLDRTVATATTRLPSAYAIARDDSALVHLLAQHDIVASRFATSRPVEIIERFIRDGGTDASGHWLREIRPNDPDTLPAGTYVVSAAQPRAVLAAILLEPLSANGLVADRVTAPGGGAYPVTRLLF